MKAGQCRPIGHANRCGNTATRWEGSMERRSIGIVVNGATGRMGYRQHLERSLLAIREQGGLPLLDGTCLWPEPVLVGRSATKLSQLAAKHGLTEWTTDLAEALARPDVDIY